MTEPRLTVAMSVYNNASYLKDALDSICAQSFREFECLIVDDGSTDGSSAILDEYAVRDPRIGVEHRSNHGLIASLNHIVDQARAPIIARMDGDDLCEPERFARQMAYLDAHPECGVLGTNAYEIDECGRRLAQCEDYPAAHDDMVEIGRAHV